MMDSWRFWVVGRIHKDNPMEWEFMGIFESQQKAESICINGRFFVGPAKLNEIVSNETKEWPGAYYPAITIIPSTKEV